MGFWNMYREIRIRRLLWIALLIPLSCSTTQREAELPGEVPDSFTATGAGPLPEKWWRSFNDPDLDQLIEDALAQNLGLRIVWDRLAQAEAIARREGAELGPSLDYSAGVSRTRTRRELTDGTRDSSTSNEFSLGISASYELDLWGRIRSKRDAAERDARANVEDVKTAAITLTAQVAQAWYQLVEQHAQLEILAMQLDTNLKVQELVTLRFRRGQVSAADVLRQRQLVESNQGESARAESRIRVLEHLLAVLLGRSPAGPVTVKRTELVSLPPLPDTGLPAELLRRRPDIRRAFEAVMAADQRAASALADRFPRLTLSARAETSTDAVGDLFETWLANLAAGLLGPILDGGRRTAEVDRTKAVLSERLNDYGRLVLESIKEVEDALVKERKQREFIASLERQLAISDQVVQRIRDTYTSGAVDYLNVLDALLSNQSLQRSRLEARRQLIEYRIDLCRSLAGGFTLLRPEPESIGEKGQDPSQGGTVHE
ncbi:MAG: efflux transporter outer membrane subunit [Planctomycetota bacterium]